MIYQYIISILQNMHFEIMPIIHQYLYNEKHN